MRGWHISDDIFSKIAKKKHMQWDGCKLFCTTILTCGWRKTQCRYVDIYGMPDANSTTYPCHTVGILQCFGTAFEKLMGVHLECLA